MPTTAPTRTVYLLGCPAYTPGPSNAECSLIGLFDIEEYHPYEPSAYVWSAGFTVTAHDDTSDEAIAYFVDADVFHEYVDPSGYGVMLLQERMANFHEEERDQEEAE